MLQRIAEGIVLRGSETEVGFLRPCRQQTFYMPCISARVRRIGMENPRFRLEAPLTRMTLDTRQRPLHDEDKSCGTQPAYIRVIYRRLSSSALTGTHGSYNKAKTKGGLIT